LHDQRLRNRSRFRANLPGLAKFWVWLQAYFQKPLGIQQLGLEEFVVALPTVSLRPLERTVLKVAIQKIADGIFVGTEMNVWRGHGDPERRVPAVRQLPIMKRDAYVPSEVLEHPGAA
jgi:hypothetical protein